MKTIAIALVISLVAIPAFAQRPSDPALLVPQTAPELDYVAATEALSSAPFQMASPLTG